MKRILITGGNRGLGLGFVNHFLNNGDFVYIGVRNPNSFNPDILPNKNYEVVKLDVTSDEDIEKAYIQISKTTDHLDMLINNAGVSKDTVVKNNKDLVYDIDKLDRNTMNMMFDINSTSPLLVIKEFLPLLRKSELGFIINVSSARASFKDEWGFDSFNYGYRGSKSALNIMTKALVGQLPSNVKTFSVDPGDVNTDMNDDGESKPTDTAQSIMNIVNNWKDEFNGEFMRFSGEPYPR